MSVRNVYTPGSNATTGFMAARARCQFRNECMIELIVDGIEILVPRPTLHGSPCCFYEVVGDLISCRDRASQLAQ